MEEELFQGYVDKLGLSLKTKMARLVDLANNLGILCDVRLSLVCVDFLVKLLHGGDGRRPATLNEMRSRGIRI